jgi:nucleotide-binding universal stress UspA family protein
MEGDKMFHHILVPLDGSRLAESALVTAGWLAGKLDAQLTLIHLIERNAPSRVHNERHLVTREEATRYLDEVSRGPGLAGLRITTHVHEVEVSDVARSIFEHSAELVPDLIVMCAHGTGGVRRLLFGVIAQQVITLGKTPVLIVYPSPGRREAEEAGEIRSIIAPIDGNMDHERSLPIAAGLAKALKCRLRLLMVVPKITDLTGSEGAVSFMLPGSTRTELEMESVAARGYLDRRVEDLVKTGIAVEAETSRGDPAQVIISAARRLSSDLVVMGTHGRAGTEAFWEGSVAAEVAARIRIPLLLVPLGKRDD